jgi:hypothetical protein
MHRCSITGELEKLVRTGEPCALKGASTVRGGAVGNELTYETTRRVFWQVKGTNSNALAAYSTMMVTRMWSNKEERVAFAIWLGHATFATCQVTPKKRGEKWPEEGQGIAKCACAIPSIR